LRLGSLRETVHASNFAHVTKTHAVNVSALWYGWISQCAAWSIFMASFVRGMHSNNHNHEICTSVYMLSNSIQFAH